MSSSFEHRVNWTVIDFLAIRSTDVLNTTTNKLWLQLQ